MVDQAFKGLGNQVTQPAIDYSSINNPVLPKTYPKAGRP